MASTIKVDKIEGSTGSTITVPTGQTFTITDGVGVASGGTGISSFTAGDVLYASGATTLTKLAKGTAEQILSMNAGETAPEWATAAPTAGGTGQTTWAAGDLLYANGSNTLTKLTKPGSTMNLQMTSAGVPSWVAAPTSDVVKLTNQSATSGSTFDLIDGFFTTDYRYYRLLLHEMESSTTNASLYIQALVSSSVDAGSYYAGTSAKSYTDSTPSNSVTAFGDADNTTSFRILYGDYMTNSTTKMGNTGWIDIYDPLSTTLYKSFNYMYGQDSTSAPIQNQFGHGTYSNTNAISGIRLYVDNGTFDRIDVTLYGYKS